VGKQRVRKRVQTAFKCKSALVPVALRVVLVDSPAACSAPHLQAALSARLRTRCRGRENLDGICAMNELCNANCYTLDSPVLLPLKVAGCVCPGCVGTGRVCERRQAMLTC